MNSKILKNRGVRVSSPFRVILSIAYHLQHCHTLLLPAVVVRASRHLLHSTCSHYGFQSLDSKALVIKAIYSACLKDSESEDEKTRTDAKARLELLTKWQK